MMPKVNRPLINANNNAEHYQALVSRQRKNDKNYDISRSYASFSIGSTVVFQ